MYEYIHVYRCVYICIHDYKPDITTHIHGHIW